MRGKCIIREGVKLAGAGVSLNGGVELCRVEGFEPDAKPRELGWSELFDGFLNVFGCSHVANIEVARDG